MRPIFALARVCFSELLRSKLLYSAILVCGALLAVGFLAARLSFIQPDRIMMDFGISAVSLCSCAVAILFGSSLIPREIERKTLFLALSRPVSRTQFILGQYFGLAAMILLNALGLIAAFLIVLVWTQDAGIHLITRELTTALSLLMVEALFLGAVAVFFSTFATSTVASILSIGVYLIGTNVSEFKAAVGSSHALKWVAQSLPNLEYFHLGTKVYYQIPITWTYWFGSIAYGISMILFFLWLSCVAIRTRELQ